MIYIKKANMEDTEKEFQFISSQPKNENGFINEFHGVNKEAFSKKMLPRIISYSEGKNLPLGYIPETYYFLWDDEEIVGLFKLRHCLNNFLRNGAGHIGYGIDSKHRGKGYASKGLALLIEEAKEIIEEDEIYLSCHKSNLASLKVQMNNGAYLHHSNERQNYTRIKIK